MTAHRAWNEADGELRLQQAGARSTLDGTFQPAARLPLDQLSRYLGTNPRARPSAFRWRDADTPTAGALSAKPA